MFDSDSAALQIAPPDVVMLQTRGQARRLPEMTVKDRAWQTWRSRLYSANSDMLNDLYGEAFSSRTNNARIVLSKRTLLSDAKSKLLDRHSPDWMKTTCAGDFVHALQADSDGTVFQSWTEHVQKRSLGGQVVFLVLDVLNSTGRRDDNLLAALL